MGRRPGPGVNGEMYLQTDEQLEGNPRPSERGGGQIQRN